jgi:hypothetical protein
MEQYCDGAPTLTRQMLASIAECYLCKWLSGCGSKEGLLDIVSPI